MAKKLTQSQIIKKYLATQEGWVKSYELRGKTTPFGFIGHQGDRRARELAEANEIEVRHENKYAEYRSREKLKEVGLYANGQLVGTRWEAV